MLRDKRSVGIAESVKTASNLLLLRTMSTTPSQWNEAITVNVPFFGNLDLFWVDLYVEEQEEDWKKDEAEKEAYEKRPLWMPRRGR